jgi:hypothetical protein
MISPALSVVEVGRGEWERGAAHSSRLNLGVKFRHQLHAPSFGFLVDWRQPFAPFLPPKSTWRKLSPIAFCHRWARKFFDYWCDRAMHSRLEPMKKVARMLRALNWFRAKADSSGAVEELNNNVTRRSYGFRTYEALFQHNRAATRDDSRESLHREWTPLNQMIPSGLR